MMAMDTVIITLCLQILRNLAQRRDHYGMTRGECIVTIVERLILLRVLRHTCDIHT